MSSFNPIALWGLTALAIPILIHLWSKNKTKEIEFGSIRFLRESSTLQSRKITLSDIPLLLVRLMILIFVVALLAKWVNYQEVEKQKAVLVGDGFKVPEAYVNDEISVFSTSEFRNTSNDWYLLEKFSQQRPEIDSLIYINDFQNTDFVGAIPKLNFHLELITPSEIQSSPEKLSLDTLLIHFDELSQFVKEKYDKVLRANYLYSGKKINFSLSNKKDAQLVFTTSQQKLQTNQIVRSDTLSSDYLIYKKHNDNLLYLNENWLQNPLNEDMFVSIVTEFIAQIIEPNYQYSSFKAIYTRKLEAHEEVKKAITFNEEFLLLIVLFIMLERYLSYRKKHA
ncbi:BatA domain-containing protein [Marivirga sp.]|uniref:BatA domain-containing protein n=1 Tax=Marivirga sp. TaxID=2018662 RepID=UPI0025CCD305|nr:BatA domain-containing protein [Marivirga sp.]